MDIFVRALNAILMVAMPLVLGVFLARRLRVEWKLFGIGAVVFVASQIFHIPFNQWVLSPGVERLGLSTADGGVSFVILAVFYGLSSGVFEETARYLAYRFWLNDERNWKSAVMFGAGHGGIEAIILGALALYALIQAFVLRDADLTTILPPEQIQLAQSQLETYWSLPWHLALMGAVERVGALCFHLSASVLVLQAFVRRNNLWVGAAILWHTTINAVALIVLQRWGVYVTEGIILFFGALSIVFVLMLRDHPRGQEPGSSAPPTREVEVEQPVFSEENLDDSRFIS
ncbi:MAG: YhfC family intramembrane metalloprotease [Anaerolineales bacterium]|nr:YhfC family intramembrane metalloprotease [Chloroflexota bacterium]MBL6980844.1 YhfC family intramembrane metalloprotease [Anaerolineales bacterium]